MYPDGVMLQEALKIKTELNDSNLDDFKVSNGWLERFKKRSGLRQTREVGDVLITAIKAWMQRLQKTFWFKTDKNSWRSRGCTYNCHQGLDAATSRNYTSLFC